MSGYNEKGLRIFKHKFFSQANAPSKHIVWYSKASQQPLKPTPTKTGLSDEDNTFITVLHALSSIAT